MKERVTDLAAAAVMPSAQQWLILCPHRVAQPQQLPHQPSQERHESNSENLLKVICTLVKCSCVQPAFGEEAQVRTVNLSVAELSSKVSHGISS